MGITWSLTDSNLSWNVLKIRCSSWVGTKGYWTVLSCFVSFAPTGDHWIHRQSSSLIFSLKCCCCCCYLSLTSLRKKQSANENWTILKKHKWSQFIIVKVAQRRQKHFARSSLAREESRKERTSERSQVQLWYWIIKLRRFTSRHCHRQMRSLWMIRMQVRHTLFTRMDL